MDILSSQSVSLTIPRADLGLLTAMAERMGWVIDKSSVAHELDEALDDIAQGRVTTHASVDAYFEAQLD